MRWVGDPAMPVERVALSPGAAGWGNHRRMLKTEGVNVLICGEQREWETCEYVRDANQLGQPCGLILRFEQIGVTVYHTGDTALFSDMKLIGELAMPDIMCVCIGDRFTMTAKLANRAVEFVGPKLAIPMHYKTFPILAESTDGFHPDGAEVREMQPGETFAYGD